VRAGDATRNAHCTAHLANRCKQQDLSTRKYIQSTTRLEHTKLTTGLNKLLTKTSWGRKAIAYYQPIV